MTWIFAIFIILLLGGIAVVATGFGESMKPAESDRRQLGLAAGPLSADDLRGIRFNSAVRGYRMDEVDELIQRLIKQLDDQQITHHDEPVPPSDQPIDLHSDLPSNQPSNEF